MIKLYKGTLIVISKSINGRGSFKLKIKIYYRYSLLKIKTYKHTMTLNNSMTLNDAYQIIKDFIDDLDKVIKLNKN